MIPVRHAKMIRDAVFSYFEGEGHNHPVLYAFLGWVDFNTKSEKCLHRTLKYHPLAGVVCDDCGNFISKDDLFP